MLFAKKYIYFFITRKHSKCIRFPQQELWTLAKGVVCNLFPGSKVFFLSFCANCTIKLAHFYCFTTHCLYSVYPNRELKSSLHVLSYRPLMRKNWMVCVYSPLQMLSVFHMLRIFPSDLFSSFKKINCKINNYSPIIQCK